jgi:hypothetical protein
MNLGPRDRRALALLGGALALAAIYYFGFSSDTETVAPVQRADSIGRSERRLQELRRTVAAVPARENTVSMVKAALAIREKGLVQADTAPQAQAQLVQIVRRILRAQQPPLELRSIDPVPPKPFDATYGEVAATVSFDGRIEQIVNLLADLGSQPELIGIQQLQLGAANGKEKRIAVRLVVSALVDRKLVPDKPRNTLGAF